MSGAKPKNRVSGQRSRSMSRSTSRSTSRSRDDFGNTQQEYMYPECGSTGSWPRNCDVCRCRLSNNASADQHYEGRRHKEAMARQGLRTDVAAPGGSEVAAARGSEMVGRRVRNRSVGHIFDMDDYEQQTMAGPIMTPAYGLPQNVKPQHGLPQNVKPQHGLPQNVKPQHGLPQNVKLQHGLPQNMKPDHVMHPHVTPAAYGMPHFIPSMPLHMPTPHMPGLMPYSSGNLRASQPSPPGGSNSSLPRHVFFILSALLTRDRPFSLRDLQTAYDQFLDQTGHITSRPKLRSTLNEYPQLFLLQANDNIPPSVSVKTTIELCADHAKKTGCDDYDCGGLHMCKFCVISSSCRFGDQCRYGHSINTAHNYRCLKQHMLDGLNIHQVRMLLKPSTQSAKYPNICKFYNKADGCKWSGDGRGCPAMHVCLHYVKGDCAMGHGKCKRLHNILAPQPKFLLQKYQVDISRSPKEVLIDVRDSLGVADGGAHASSDLDQSHDASSPRSGIQLPPGFASGGARSRTTSEASRGARSRTTSEASQGARSRTTSEVTDDGRDVLICMFNLRDSCLYKDKCTNAHCEQPYQWQYRVGSGWRDFDAQSNNEIEFNYHDPNNDVCMSDSLQQDLASLSPFKIDFEKMVAIWTTSGRTEVRRLSTISAVKAPAGQTLSTRWLWYWKDDGEWRQYGEGSHKTTLTIDELETAYLQDSNGSLTFNTQHNRYSISFKKMRQKNMITGVVRPMSRRSALQVKTPSGSARVSGPVGKKKSSGPDVPSHWDMDAHSNDPYFQLVQINNSGSTAEEFLRVKQLFENTLVPPDCKIISIERIQNIELWEGFTWKRYWMKQKNAGKVDPIEKLLFHGAREEFLDAICRQGLDWRLSGSTCGTMYGKGSYFARDANYSECYAQTKMLLVRVLVGEFAAGAKTYTRPPQKADLSLYDSCVDNVKDPKIYVVFDQQQSYPEYVITFSKKRLI